MKGEVSSVNRNRRSSMCDASLNGSRKDLCFQTLKDDIFVIDYKYSLKEEEIVIYETDFCTVVVGGSIRNTGREIEMIKYHDILRNNWNWKLALKVLNELKVYNTLRDKTKMVNLVDILLLIKFKSPEDKSRKICNCEFRDIYFVYERCGNDLGYILKSPPFDIKTQQQWLLSELLSAVSSLHSQKLIHRKLCPSNVYVSFEEKILKLRDFGSSSGFSSKVVSLLNNEEEEDDEEDDEITPIYTAPEIILGRAITPSVDVWGVGCIFAEILSGGSPLFFLPSGAAAEHTDDVYKIGMIIKTLETTLKKLSPNPLAIDLLRRMLEFYPNTRISVEEAMQHSYFGTAGGKEGLVSRVAATEEEYTEATAAIGLGVVDVTEPDAHSLRKLIWNEMKTFEMNNQISEMNESDF